MTLGVKVVGGWCVAVYSTTRKEVELHFHFVSFHERRIFLALHHCTLPWFNPRRTVCRVQADAAAKGRQG